jgi:hypothetical protein
MPAQLPHRKNQKRYALPFFVAGNSVSGFELFCDPASGLCHKCVGKRRKFLEYGL